MGPSTTVDSPLSPWLFPRSVYGAVTRITVSISLQSPKALGYFVTAFPFLSTSSFRILLVIAVLSSNLHCIATRHFVLFFPCRHVKNTSAEGAHGALINTEPSSNSYSS